MYIAPDSEPKMTEKTFVPPHRAQCHFLLLYYPLHFPILSLDLRVLKHWNYPGASYIIDCIIDCWAIPGFLISRAW